MNGQAADDLTAEALAEALPGRPLRAYPAILSTEADAMSWARMGAPAGAVVVAGYQASPRGRAGRPWEVDAERGLVFSLVLRPGLPPMREGWLYTVAVSAVADVLGRHARIRWPDEVVVDGATAGAVGIHGELGPEAVDWAVVTAMFAEAPQPRGIVLARVVERLEERLGESAEALLAEYRPRCETLGRRVRARMIPLGPAGPQVEGEAVSSVTDGALVIRTDEGRRVAIRPQNLGLLEDADRDYDADGLRPWPPGAPDGPAPR